MAWLYLPGVEDSNSDSPLRSELITEQSPTLKGKPRPHQSWQRTWNAGGWIRHLSGMTLEPSRAMSLAHSWIRSTLSQPGSPASRGASPEGEQEPLTTDGSGLSSSDWFARYDPEASSWRTSQVSFMEELNTYSATWPRAGSLRNGQVSERQTLVRPIAGSGFLSWPTSNARDWKGASGLPGQFDLPGEAERWATPTGRDYKDGDGTANVPTNALLGLQAPRTPMPGNKSMNNTSRRLNPLFVEWLMGWPQGWLELTGSASSGTE